MKSMYNGNDVGSFIYKKVETFLPCLFMTSDLFVYVHLFVPSQFKLDSIRFRFGFSSVL